MSDNASGRPSRFRTVLRFCLRQAERGLALIGLGMLLFHGCFNYSRVTSKSMHPTLQGTNWDNGDRVLTEKMTYWLRQPRRWEVITYRREDGEQIMKRVIGLPGEQVQMLRGGRLLIDGEPLEVPAELDFLHYFPFGNVIEDKTVPCDDGYYVLGDYAQDSDDSRFNGPIPREKLIGRARWIVGPAGRRGFVR